MEHKLNERSLERLKGVHPDLAKVVCRASLLHAHPIIVTEGLRTVERQAELLAAGASRTMKSRHLTGHAVDLAVVINGEARWDWPLYDALSTTVKRAANELGVPVEWGGDWPRFRDGPHYQLPPRDYPEGQAAPATVEA